MILDRKNCFLGVLVLVVVGLFSFSDLLVFWLHASR